MSILFYVLGEYDPITGKKIKKKKATRPGEEGPDQYEYVSDGHKCGVCLVII